MTAREKGFTLVEVLAAVAVVAIAFTVLLSTEALNLERTLHAERLLAASRLARERMEEALAGGGSALSSGEGRDDSGVFAWTAVVLETPYAGLREYRLTLRWSEGRREESYTVAAYFLE